MAALMDRSASQGVFTSRGISSKLGPFAVETVVYELVDVRGVKTDADSCEYRDSVLFEDEIVAKDMRLSFSDIFSVIVDLLVG
jgi:hypothetical protein